MTATAPITSEIDRVLSREEAAEILGLAPKTLDNWRSQGRGPDYVSYSPTGRVRYRREDVIAFRDAHVMSCEDRLE